MMHQNMNSEVASSSSPKRARLEEEVRTNETIHDLQELSETQRELDQVTKTLLRFEEDRDMWTRLFEEIDR